MQNSKPNFKCRHVFDEISAAEHGLILSENKFDQKPWFICVTENNTIWIACGLDCYSCRNIKIVRNDRIVHEMNL